MNDLKFSKIKRYNQIAITSGNNHFHFDDSPSKMQIKNLSNDYVFMKINNSDFLLMPLETIFLKDMGYIRDIDFVTVPCLITMEVYS